MRVGFLSDIHGNLFALDAVLADLETQDVDRVVCLGDVCFGPLAHECLARVRHLGCPVVLGNWDSWSVHGFPVADDPIGLMLNEIGEFWARLLTDDDRAFVETFVATHEMQLDGRRAFCFHGSPRSFSDWIFATTPDADLERMFDGVDAPVLVGGHTHLQMVRRFGPAVIVNPGSVGQPFAQWWPKTIRVAHWAEYGVLEASDANLRIDLRRVPFDLEGLLRHCRESGMPHAQWWVDSWDAV